MTGFMVQGHIYDATLNLAKFKVLLPVLMEVVKQSDIVLYLHGFKTVKTLNFHYIIQTGIYKGKRKERPATFTEDIHLRLRLI